MIVETKDSDELQLHESAGTVECWFLMKGEGISTAPRLIAKESITNDCDCDPLRGETDVVSTKGPSAPFGYD